ncbi:MAG TPA: biotin transporter BioY [bacterium (Candidatus Stahlbacteria)]|nr:biotin transporter BioY [Candidatus Stahlbacteria bacterium]
MIRTLDQRLPLDRELILVPTFALLTALGAKVKIPLPFTPVPITLQVFFVLLSGSFRTGYMSQILYLSLGLLGAPFFAFGGGIGYLAGPTGGYLIAFPIASYLIGWLIERGRPFYLAAAASILVIYLLGTMQLAIVLQIPLLKAILIGAIPFIPYDTIKAIGSAYLIREIKNWR